MKRLILNQVTLCADGSIGLQWLKQFVDADTGEVLFSEPHRSVVDFDGDIDAQTTAITAHLQSMGYPAADTAMIDRVKAIDAVARSDAAIEAARAEKIAIKEALLEQAAPMPTIKR